ncbi:hypothetical protein JY651_36950 [Pyxidicoccus parkwayensis]|uniref:Lipoprotein n=1 Tax=Pyxidicoccus parkwayensis TaxID=2813578 RepID=A0ABX7NTS8_9BACT|nr:hypothetical protein [Pyxidicoccus parkwaysis]QSQ20779.1 hypothetical protein JY651_36950 [Pyxidicoccus parkwaysis]
MKSFLKLSALVLFAAASSAMAGSVYGPFFARYLVDLNAHSPTGTPLYPTFTPPGASAPVPYETFTVADSVSNTGTCWKVAATRLGSTAEQKMWMESSPGTWMSLADDVVNTLDPGAYVYTERSTETVIRIADYRAYTTGSQGQFFVALTSLFYPNETRLQSCDRFAAADGWPYVRISASGVVTFVKRQGSP